MHYLTNTDFRHCLKVGPSTVEAIARTCRKLKYVNLSFTGATAASLQVLVSALPDLEVLKIAGIQNLVSTSWQIYGCTAFMTRQTDSTFARILSTIQRDTADESALPLQHLKSLKIRHDNISDATILPILQHCRMLERLDLSFTLLRHLPDSTSELPIEKLSLTSTFVSSKDLVALIAGLPRLKVLIVGAMGVKAGTSSSVATATAMTLTDDALRQLTDALRNCPLLESVNLVQNSKLGMTKRSDSALAYFIRHAGRRCQVRS